MSSKLEFIFQQDKLHFDSQGSIFSPNLSNFSPRNQFFSLIYENKATRNFYRNLFSIHEVMCLLKVWTEMWFNREYWMIFERFLSYPLITHYLKQHTFDNYQKNPEQNMLKFTSPIYIHTKIILTAINFLKA